MIYRKKREQADRKIHPLIGLLLFLISIVLLLTTGDFGLIYGIFHSLVKRGFKGLGEYFLQIAISVDQLVGAVGRARLRLYNRDRSWPTAEG